MPRPTTKKPHGVSLAWAKRLRRIPGYDPIATAGRCTFDAATAQAALDFFPAYLKHVKGEKGGAPFTLEPWQAAIVANLFGWKRPDGTRRYRELFLFVPRKNGKTPLSAGLVLLTLFCDPEPGAEIYSAAADRDQASLVFAHAKGMVLQDPELSQKAQIYETARSIVLDDRQSSYKVISADANTKHGFNSHLVIVDELHAQPSRELVDVLATSTGARRQPLIVYTTTSDYERPSICNEKYDYAAKVRDGIIEDPNFLPVIYEASRDDDYTSPKVWAACNPNLGVSLSREYVAAACKRAQETPSFLNTFLRLHLNIKTEQDVRWLDMAAWDGGGAPLDPAELEGRPCWGGVDLASTSDLCALVLFFPDDDNSALAYFWVPEDTARIRDRRSRVPYLTWAREGALRLTEGNVADYDVIREDINALGARYDIQEIAIDRWNSTHLQTQLQGDGFDIVQFGQGFASMSAPAKELERLVQSNGLRHGGQPVLRWCASNVMVETDAAGNLKPSKKRSAEKIDGIVALVMAIGRAQVRAEAGPSVYETRGILTL